MVHHLSFDISQHEDGETMITPVIDGVSLIRMVTNFENNIGHCDIAGGYGGLIPSFYNYGPLNVYFMGGTPHFIEGDKSWAYLLGCECGEVGCWPITTSIQVESETVTWCQFSQPHRPKRDYSNFGPFVFNKQQYVSVLKALTGFPPTRELAEGEEFSYSYP